MKLNSISVSGFRSLEHLTDLKIGSPLVLAGHNDAGKSAIIDAILFLLGGYAVTESDATYLPLLDGGDPPEAEGERRVGVTSVEGDFALSESEQSAWGRPRMYIRRKLVRGGAPSLEYLTDVPADERLRDYGSLNVAPLRDRLEDLGLSRDGNKSDLIQRLDEAAAAAESEEQWATASGALEKALPTAKRFDATSAIDADTAIQSTLQTAYKAHLGSEEYQGNIRQIEESIEKKLVLDADAIRDHIATKVTDVGEVTIQPVVNLGGAGGLKSARITLKNSLGEKIDLHLSGAGRARRIALAVWEYNAMLLAESAEDIVLLYDEPDTHLDYGHQRELMRLIHEQTQNPKVTVVLASHSMNLIDGTDIADVAHIKHVDHRTVVERLTDDSSVGAHLGAIAASVGLRNTVLLHERLFVGVEGESEARALPVLFRLAMGRHLESCGIAIWPCNNNDGAVRFATFLAQHGRNVAFLVDKDSKSHARHIFSDQKLRAVGLEPTVHCLYIGDSNEIEDVFSGDQWAAVANALWPRDGEDETSTIWLGADFDAHRSSKFSSKVLDMLRKGSSKAPSGKPEALLGLALSLREPSEVPAALVAEFEAMIARAI
ncbi:ATP-dependent nuclease [Clavibacter michiganensis]|uniref:ATP-dependent nuclease n=1 Tax=Clavibacter michiganensis TaxID=28447 RepID=UPI0015E224E1|nr:AAA family ATPase [Clavibacter michiganensis]